MLIIVNGIEFYTNKSFLNFFINIIEIINETYYKIAKNSQTHLNIT